MPIELCTHHRTVSDTTFPTIVATRSPGRQWGLNHGERLVWDGIRLGVWSQKCPDCVTELDTMGYQTLESIGEFLQSNPAISTAITLGRWDLLPPYTLRTTMEL